MNKKAFSFVEIIITISILAILSVIAYSSMSDYNNTRDNTKVQADLETIKNSLELYSADFEALPVPEWNNNYFKIDMQYAHTLEDSETFWVYGSFTQNTLAKKYLDTLPLDPKTNSYYAYGITNPNYQFPTNQFELAWVIKGDEKDMAKVVWNYTAETWPFNLIRAYNNFNFVEDESEYLPYNPNELILTATDKDWNIYRQWDIIETTSESKELFFSDGSVSILEANSKITLTKAEFPNENNLTTNIKLFLEAGSIWTKATKLDEDSHFEIYSSYATAAVRGTIFWVTKNTSDTQITLIEWVIEVSQDEEVIEEIIVEAWANPKEITIWDINSSTKEITEPIEIDFIQAVDSRGSEILANIIAETTGDNTTNEEEITDNEIEETPVEDETEEEETLVDEEDEKADCFNSWEGSSYLEHWELWTIFETSPITWGYLTNTYEARCNDGAMVRLDNIVDSQSISCNSDFHEASETSCESDTKTCYIWDLEGSKNWNRTSESFWQCTKDLTFYKPDYKTYNLWTSTNSIYINWTKVIASVNWDILIKWKSNNTFYIKKVWEYVNLYTGNYSTDSLNIKIQEN